MIVCSVPAWRATTRTRHRRVGGSNRDRGSRAGGVGAREGFRGCFLTGITDPELRGDKELVPGNPAVFDRVPHGFFIPVCGGGVDEAVPRRERARREMTDGMAGTGVT